MFPDISFAIRKEIVEIEERRKRKDSLIFRGIMSTNMEARMMISRIAVYLLNCEFPILGVFHIDQPKGIYRIKCANLDL